MGLIIPLTIILAGGGFLVLKKKQHPHQIEADIQVTKRTSRGSDNVRALQQQLNSLLPSSYPKLVVDGIWGAKTAAAFDYVMTKTKLDKLTKDQLLSSYYVIHGKHWQPGTKTSSVHININRLTGQLSYPKRWYLQKADELYNAMEPSGTDTFTVRAIIRQLKTKDDWKALITAFDYRKCNNCWFFDGGDLIDWLWRELFTSNYYYKTQNFIVNKLRALGLKIPDNYQKKHLYAN